MNNKHLIKELEKIWEELPLDVGLYMDVGSTNFKKDKNQFMNQLLSLFLSEKKDLINKFSEIIGENEDTTLKDLDPRLYNMELNQVHRIGRNELRQELRAKLSQLEDLQSKEVKE